MRKGQRTLQIFYSFGAAILGIWMLTNIRVSQHPFQVCVWEIFTAIAFYGTIGCFHDAAHLTLLPSRRFNAWFGRLYGILILVSYSAYRRTHILHHAYLTRPNDLECWPYCDPAATLRFRRVFVWIDLLLGSLTGPYIYTRVYFRRGSGMPASLRAKILAELLLIAACWAALFAHVHHHRAWSELAKAWVLPHLMAGMLQSGNKFFEHLGLGSYDPYFATRTVAPRSRLSKLASLLTFQISHQGLHHRYSRYPAALLRARARKRDFPYFEGYLAAARAALKACVRNPGMGVNAGARPPADPKLSDARDFVFDLTRDVLNASEVAPAPRRA